MYAFEVYEHLPRRMYTVGGARDPEDACILLMRVGDDVISIASLRRDAPCTITPTPARFLDVAVPIAVELAHALAPSASVELTDAGRTGPIPLGTPLKLKATVSGSAGVGVPTGTVTFATSAGAVLCAAVALRVIDKIRDGFAQVKHYFGSQEFNISFSCGIAPLESFDDAATLYEAADKALYKAKHGGRNRVVMAEDRAEVPPPPAQ